MAVPIIHFQGTYHCEFEVSIRRNVTMDIGNINGVSVLTINGFNILDGRLLDKIAGTSYFSYDGSEYVNGSISDWCEAAVDGGTIVFASQHGKQHNGGGDSLWNDSVEDLLQWIEENKGKKDPVTNAKRQKVTKVLKYKTGKRLRHSGDVKKIVLGGIASACTILPSDECLYTVGKYSLYVSHGAAIASGVAGIAEIATGAAASSLSYVYILIGY